MMNIDESARIYRHALYYDIAFDFRDVDRECAALRHFAGRHGRPVQSFLETACGPGRHVLTMGREGIPSAGIDLSPAMCELLNQRAAAAGVPAEAVAGDIRAFQFGRQFDLAAILMDTTAHLLTNADMAAHLRAVAANLAPDGVYVMEMAHPAAQYNTRVCSGTRWHMERAGISVAVRWGELGDPFDPIAEIDTISVTFIANDPACGEVTETAMVKQRRWTCQAFLAVLDQVPEFELAAMYGALDPHVPFDNSDAAWRMVPVLRRRRP